MIFHRHLGFGVLVASLLQVSHSAHAEPRLAGVFADHMVLQQGRPIPVWGWAGPSHRVTVNFAGQSKSALADAAGQWKTELDPLPASPDPRTLEASEATAGIVRISDVLVGEVWLCSGQSNMEYRMRQLAGTAYAGDLTDADDPLLRQAAVPRQTSLTPTNDVRVQWTGCSAATVGSFTAAGYYFGRTLRARLGVPVGLVLSAWGGTSAESWTSLPALESDPEFRRRAETQIANLKALPDAIRAYPAKLVAWQRTNGRVDAKSTELPPEIADPGADGAPGKRENLQDSWAHLGLPHGGIAWIEKTIDLPQAAAGKGFQLNFGPMEGQHLQAYWNGVRLTPLGVDTPPFAFIHPLFNVPGAKVRAGRNVLALRYLVETAGRAPLNRSVLQLGFFMAGLHQLADQGFVWPVRRFAPLTAAALKERPLTPQGDAAHTSAELFNGMIAPLVPLAIRGCVWYQGESDADRALAYRRELPLLIRDWRGAWKADFPFIVQQLPNWAGERPGVAHWAELREAQDVTARSVPGCWLSAAIDIGDPENIHPANKREAGRRLALVAMARVYGRQVADSGPVFRSAAVDGNSVRLTFDEDRGLRSLNGKPLTEFELAGADGKFQPAAAVIADSGVIVTNAAVRRPRAVRYAFSDNPVGLNFTNASGLPARPFRTELP